MKQHMIPLLAVAVFSVAATLPAAAEERHRERGEGNRGEMRQEMRFDQRHDARHEMRREDRRGAHVWWRGDSDIRHFEGRHLHVWRSGVWHHSLHEGRLGWWWVVAGTWYFYPMPIYPYPDPYVPPFVVVQPNPAPEPAAPAMQAPTQYWYYCEASKRYYPYVSNCAAGWKEVPATPPSAPAK